MIALEITVFVLLLAFSAFFSGAEAAFFSLSNTTLARTKETEQIMEILRRPRRLLITLLTGNTVVNTMMAFFAALITADIALKAGANVPLLLAAETVVVTVVILLVSEITPKILALKNSQTYARRVSLPVRIVSLILYPVAALLYKLTHFLTGWLPFKKEQLFESKAELRTLADLGADRGSLNEEETRMIKSVFDYGETAVREIMVPRIDVVGIEKETTVEKAIEIIQNTRLSKFPVYNQSIDSIEGMLYAKDLLPHLNGGRDARELLSFCREPFFVPESKQIDDLLRDFQQRREMVAVVVDEYGGTAGLVTVEDIVEEVVGEIRDEFDRDSPLIIPVRKKQWLVDAKIAINDLQDRLPIPFPEEREYDTMAGFLFLQFGDIPSPGERIEFEGYDFEVRTVSGNRIVQVVVTET
ncbi:MAG: hemolysin family protein [Candidatus Neomarinimicrobiota bacterium]